MHAHARRSDSCTPRPTRVSRVTLLGLIADEAFRDGRIEPWEEALLRAAARSFEVSPEAFQAVIQRSRRRYRERKLGRPRPLDPRHLMRKVYAAIGPDGPADAVESRRVESLRRAFVLSEEEARTLAAEAAGHPIRKLRLLTPPPPGLGSVDLEALTDPELGLGDLEPRPAPDELPVAPVEAPVEPPDDSDTPGLQQAADDLAAALKAADRKVLALQASELPIPWWLQAGLVLALAAVLLELPYRLLGVVPGFVLLLGNLALAVSGLVLGRRLVASLWHAAESELVVHPDGLTLPGRLLGLRPVPVPVAAERVTSMVLHKDARSLRLQALTLVVDDAPVRLEAEAFSEDLSRVVRVLERRLDRRVRLDQVSGPGLAGRVLRALRVVLLVAVGMRLLL